MLGHRLACRNKRYYKVETRNRWLINGIYIRSAADLGRQFEEMTAVSAVSSKAELQKMYESFTSMVLVSVIFLVVFSGLLGGAVIYGTTIMSIRERTGEFSSLRVLGYSRQEIFRLLAGENLLLAALDLLLGVPLGWGLVKLMGLSLDRKSTRLNSSHITRSRMPSSA